MGLMSFFIEEDGKKEEKSTPLPQQHAQGGPPPLFATSTPAQPPSPGYHADIQPYPSMQNYIPTASQEDLVKFNQHFDEVFDKSKIPGSGPGYNEFYKMCQAMASLPDNTKIAAVFSGLAVQGLTKPKLIDSANQLISAIDNDVAQFNSTVDVKLKGDSLKKRNDAQAITDQITKKTELIAQLTIEINNDQAKANQLNFDADEQDKKAESKVSAYKSVSETRKAQIVADVNKINTFIQ